MAFVHLGSPEDGEKFLARWGMDDVHHFSDPQAALYRAFGLARAPLSTFLDTRMWRRAVQAISAGHGLGVPGNDPRRLGGVFLLHRGEVLRSLRHAGPADRPDYLSLGTLQPGQ